MSLRIERYDSCKDQSEFLVEITNLSLQKFCKLAVGEYLIPEIAEIVAEYFTRVNSVFYELGNAYKFFQLSCCCKGWPHRQLSIQNPAWDTTYLIFAKNHHKAAKVTLFAKEGFGVKIYADKEDILDQDRWIVLSGSYQSAYRGAHSSLHFSQEYPTDVQKFTYTVQLNPPLLEVL